MSQSQNCEGVAGQEEVSGVLVTLYQLASKSNQFIHKINYLEMSLQINVVQINKKKSDTVFLTRYYWHGLILKINKLSYNGQNVGGNTFIFLFNIIGFHGHFMIRCQKL